MCREKSQPWSLNSQELSRSYSVSVNYSSYGNPIAEMKDLFGWQTLQVAKKFQSPLVTNLNKGSQWKEVGVAGIPASALCRMSFGSIR